MSPLPIARIIHPVTLCSLETDPAVLLTQCLQADTSFGVVLDRHRHPVGVVRLHRLLCLALPSSPSVVGETEGGRKSLPIRLAETALIEPVGLLPAALSLLELCQYLGSRESGHWAIVDSQGQFLGLLNSERALSWLAEQVGNTLPTVPVPAFSPGIGCPTPLPVANRPLGRSLSAGEATSVFQGQGGAHLRATPPLAAIHTLPPPTETAPTALPVGWQWLDWLPLPLQLQTETGIVLGQNRAWSEVMGDRADLSPQTLIFPQPETHLSHSHPPPSSTVAPRAAAPSIETDPDDVWSEYPPDRTASDAPCGRISPPLAATPDDTYAYGCILATREEKIWQLVQLPLPATATPTAGFYPTGGRPEAESGPTLGDGQHRSFLRLLVAIEVTPIYAQSQRLLAENQELRQQNQAKDEFLMSLSHDIKTPLTAILGLASLMQSTTVGPLNARQHQYIQLIHHNARLLTTLANQSFELACLDAGQLILNCQPVDLEAVCERAIAQAQAGYEAQSLYLNSPSATATPTADQPEPARSHPRRVIQTAWEIDKDQVYLVADELRLCQMLTHLLSNALKFSSPTDPVGLRISCWHPNWLGFTVWDKGMGIPATEQPHLFQKLQQLQVAHSPYPGGVGLGLALTYRLVRLHGGVISFVSQAGVGSEFTLLLPASGPGLSPPTQSGVGDEVASTAAMIVLVGEAPSSQGQGLLEALQALGCRVVVARFPQDLLEKAQCLRPAVIFLDEAWLVDTDASLLTLLKADPNTAGIPVIATVSRGQGASRGASTSASLLHAQVDGILNLPAPISLLQSWLEYLAMLQSGESCRGPASPPAPTPLLTQSLTLLSLSQLLPDSPLEGASVEALSERLPINLPHLFSQYQHRLLEADDLEQAALLATVWHPDLLLVRGDTLTDPSAYLAQIKAYPELASRAIVILNVTDPTPWLQTDDLNVFPYQLNQIEDVTHFLAYLHQIAAAHAPKPGASPPPLPDG